MSISYFSILYLCILNFFHLLHILEEKGKSKKGKGKGSSNQRKTAPDSQQSTRKRVSASPGLDEAGGSSPDGHSVLTSVSTSPRPAPNLQQQGEDRSID